MIDSSTKKELVVNPREIAYFEKNLPLHAAVLRDMINKGEARISGDAERSA